MRLPLMMRIQAILIILILLFGYVICGAVLTIVGALIGANDSQTDSTPTGFFGVSPQVMRFEKPILEEMEKQKFDTSWLPVLLAHVQVESGGNAEKTPDIFQVTEYARGANQTNQLSTTESIHYGVACMKNAVKSLSKAAGHKLSATDVNDVNLTSDYYNFSSLDWWMKTHNVKKWSKTMHVQFYAWAGSLGAGHGDIDYYKKILKYYDPSTGSLVGAAENASKAAGKAIKIALEQRGKPYVWGQTGPNSFDCSGLVIYSFKKAGIEITGRPTTKTMYAGNANFKRIKKEDLKAGDLILFALNGSVDHVGIYMGNDQMINAETDSNPLPKQIEVANVGKGSYWTKHISGYSRVK